MKELTAEQCDQVDGGLIGLIILGVVAVAAIAGSAYAGYKYEESQDPKCSDYPASASSS